MIPQLRFPEFDGDWKTKKFGDIYSFKTTNSFSRDKLNYLEGSVKNIHYGDIHKKFNTLFDIGNENVPYINPDVDIQRISTDNYCKEGDLVIADASEDLNDIGKSIELFTLNNEKVLAGLHTFIARPKEGSLAKGYGGYLMKSPKVRLQVQKEAQGTKVLGISTGRLSKVELPFPTLPEQQKIASFFTALDQKLTHLKRKKTLLENYKKGVMQKIFSREIRFRDDEGGKYPDWEKKRLGEVGKTYNGITGKTKDDFGEGKPYVQYKQIFDDSKIDIARFGLVGISPKENQNRVLFGDVFFTVSSETPNEIGTASVLLDEVEELYLNSFCFGYRANSFDILNPYFSRYLFRSKLFRNEIVKLAQGSTRYNMSKIELLKIIVNLPSLPEQTKIANFLSAIDKKIEGVAKAIEVTEKWKKGLMQQMFC